MGAKAKINIATKFDNLASFFLGTEMIMMASSSRKNGRFILDNANRTAFFSEEFFDFHSVLADTPGSSLFGVIAKADGDFAIGKISKIIY